VRNKKMLEIESDPYSIFVFAMNAPQTKEKYITRLKRFFDFIKLPGSTMQERCKYFVDKSKNKDGDRWLLNNLLGFLQVYKERVQRKEITGATLRNYVKTIKLFCEMNDVLVPWKKITRGLPKGRKYADDRAPSLEEIQKIIEYPDRRIKAIVYTMTSSGIRLGAWDYLRWEHIQPIRRKIIGIKDNDNNNEKERDVLAAKIIVYSGEEGDEYFSFITPEAFYELEKWMDYRKSSGESINRKSWVLRNVWNTKIGFKRGLVTEPEKLKSSGVKRIMEDALWTQRLRSKLEPGKRRHEFQTDHGFRKWFKTRCEIAGMKPINREKLMGHSTGISDSYYRATENELLEDYLKAVPELTISSEYRLQKDLGEKEKQSKIDIANIRSQLYEKEQSITMLTEENSSNTDAIAALSDKLDKLMEEIGILKKERKVKNVTIT
jgi:integrase